MPLKVRHRLVTRVCLPSHFHLTQPLKFTHTFSDHSYPFFSTMPYQDLPVPPTLRDLSAVADIASDLIRLCEQIQVGSNPPFR